MMPESYTFDMAVDEIREEYITNQLIAHNRANEPTSQTQFEKAPIHIYIQNSEDETVGGLIGWTHRFQEWLEVTVIWVREQDRGQGLGRQLMELVETEAVNRGCRFARLATSDYQGPVFYEKLGYHLYGKLEDFPPGETGYYFWKEL